MSNKGWYKSFKNLKSEYLDAPLTIQGEIPSDLKGSLLRIGPGEFTRFGQRLPHWFDGNGYALKLRFDEGRVRGSCRFLKTRTWKKEEKQGRLIYGSYGIGPRGLWRRL